MPGGRVLPGLGLKAFFDLGEDGWNDEMDTNMLVLAALVQPRVVDIINADPGAPVDGDIYFFGATHPTNANKVAIRDNGAWVYIPAFEGMELYSVAANTKYRFDGAALVALTDSPSAIFPTVATDADDFTLTPANVGLYNRLTGAAAKLIHIALDATTALPANGEWHFRNVGAGDATITPVVGVTVNAPAGGTLVVPQHATVTLKRVAADIFDLFGQTVSAP